MGPRTDDKALPMFFSIFFFSTIFFNCKLFHIYEIFDDFMPVNYNLISEVISSHKCHMNVGPTLKGHGAKLIWKFMMI